MLFLCVRGLKFSFKTLSCMRIMMACNLACKQRLILKYIRAISDPVFVVCFLSINYLKCSHIRQPHSLCVKVSIKTMSCMRVMMLYNQCKNKSLIIIFQYIHYNWRCVCVVFSERRAGWVTIGCVWEIPSTLSYSLLL